MIGFLVAGACAVGLICVGRSRRHGLWRGPFMYRFFSRIDASPAQERVIRSAFAEVRDAMSDMRNQANAARSELSDLAAAEAFDEDKMGSWFANRQRTFDDLKPTVTRAFKQIHDVLDNEQRRKLGRMIQSGPFGRRFGPRFSHHGHC